MRLLYAVLGSCGLYNDPSDVPHYSVVANDFCPHPVQLQIHSAHVFSGQNKTKRPLPQTKPNQTPKHPTSLKTNKRNWHISSSSHMCLQHGCPKKGNLFPSSQVSGFSTQSPHRPAGPAPSPSGLHPAWEQWPGMPGNPTPWQEGRWLRLGHVTVPARPGQCTP